MGKLIIEGRDSVLLQIKTRSRMLISRDNLKVSFMEDSKEKTTKEPLINKIETEEKPKKRGRKPKEK